jgi:hypothetical protein
MYGTISFNFQVKLNNHPISERIPIRLQFMRFANQEKTFNLLKLIAAFPFHTLNPSHMPIP